jgi:hypothetical protein
MAIQELRAEGLSAAYSNLPIGSKAKLTNPASGLEIEVTIIEQILKADRQYIDLSPAAALALEIGPGGGPVLVMPLSPQQDLFAVKEAAKPEPQILTEVDVNRPANKEPFNIIINNYIIHPQNPLQPKDADDKLTQENKPPEPKIDNSIDTPAISEYIDLPEPEPEVAVLPPPEPEPEIQASKVIVFSSPPVHDIQIIPGLPDPNTDKKYRLLVGAFPAVENAFLAYLQLQAAGFDVAQEQNDNVCKIFADGIPASMVYYATQRLGAIGFQQVWIQD